MGLSIRYRRRRRRSARRAGCILGEAGVAARASQLQLHRESRADSGMAKGKRGKRGRGAEKQQRRRQEREGARDIAALAQGEDSQGCKEGKEHDPAAIDHDGGVEGLEAPAGQA